MCGIFGYVGKKDAANIILKGLKRLEYRGYDSWGIAISENNKINVFKKIGAIGETKKPGDLKRSYVGVGHTRWATHGGVTEINAHPHYSSDKKFVVAQNGIVENYQELKEKLISKGYKFVSQTDTEVIVHLIEEEMKSAKGYHQAIRKAFLQLKGRNTIILSDRSGSYMAAVRNGSPLVVGLGDGEYFIASDSLSFADHTNKVWLIENLEMVEYENESINVYDVSSDKKLVKKTTSLDSKEVEIDKEGYDHFMIKEIVEQQFTIPQAVSYSEIELQPLLKAIKAAKTVYTVGAGTAGFAAGMFAYFLRKYANKEAIELKSYEVDSYINLFKNGDLIIAVSQSGETADTIDAIDKAKTKGVKIASLVNMLGSTISRMSDYPYFSRSGAEICVASTKAFTAQVSFGLLVALSLVGKYTEIQAEFSQVARFLSEFFSEKTFAEIKRLVKKLVKKEHFFVLGRGQNFYSALEAALKVKEISYKHFEGFGGGELKHGVIALVEKGTPVFNLISDDETKSDMLSAVAEVRARGAMTIAIASESNQLFDEVIKMKNFKYASPIINVIPFQLISYFMAVSLDRNPDRPRNLAKSVTVR